jgi:hypothetical protein
MCIHYTIIDTIIHHTQTNYTYCILHTTTIIMYQGCSWANLGDFDLAYKALKIAAIKIEAPRSNTLK